jgi:hypothetical protein
MEFNSPPLIHVYFLTSMGHDDDPIIETRHDNLYYSCG